jgi:hypothetical protein
MIKRCCGLVDSLDFTVAMRLENCESIAIFVSINIQYIHATKRKNRVEIVTMFKGPLKSFATRKLRMVDFVCAAWP